VQAAIAHHEAPAAAPADARWDPGTAGRAAAVRGALMPQVADFADMDVGERHPDDSVPEQERIRQRLKTRSLKTPSPLELSLGRSPLSGLPSKTRNLQRTKSIAWGVFL
jgi:hypothetical protein